MLLTHIEYQQLYERQQGVVPSNQPGGAGDNSRKSVVKQWKYDGTTDWMDFQLQFETNVKANRWQGDDLFYQLVGSLEGDTLKTLSENNVGNDQ